jgi:hypothetical protein
MSEAGELWEASADKPYELGPGTPRALVRYVDCPVCGAKAGQLCRFKTGPCIGHHAARGSEYLHQRRAGKIPRVIGHSVDELTETLRLVRQQAEAGEHHEDPVHRRHFTCLAIRNLARAIEQLVREGKP